MDKATFEYLIHYARRLVNGPYKNIQKLGVTGDDLVSDVVEKYLRDAERGVDRTKENLGYHRKSIRNKAKDYLKKKRYQVSSDELENYVQEAGGFLQDPTVTASKALRESIDGVSSPGAAEAAGAAGAARREAARRGSARREPPKPPGPPQPPPEKGARLMSWRFSASKTACLRFRRSAKRSPGSRSARAGWIATPCFSSTCASLSLRTLEER